MQGPPPSQRRRPLRLVLSTGVFLLAVLAVGGSAALAQAGYTGVPVPPPPGDLYVDPVSVDPYTGVRPPTAVVARLPAPQPPSGPNGVMSVATGRLDDLPPGGDGGNRALVTGWDLVSLAGLGLTAVVAFAVSAGRFRAR